MMEHIPARAETVIDFAPATCQAPEI